MSDWNDVITVLNHDPAIRSWAPLPGTTRTVQASIATEGHGEIGMILDNGSNEHWLQLLITVSETSEARIWEAAGWCLRDIPAIGLAQLGDGIMIRHGILLPHATIHAITNGITLAVTAATTLFDATTTTNPPQPFEGGNPHTNETPHTSQRGVRGEPLTRVNTLQGPTNQPSQQQRPQGERP